MKKLLGKEDLVGVFQEAGLSNIPHLVVHSSLSSLGRVEGGVETVVDALLEALGPGGTLMVPTFNYVLEDGIFDPDLVPSQTGAITEAVRKRAEAVRSLHPTYSVAAIGRDAVELTTEHWQAEPVGIDSPIDRLARKGGYVLLLGVKHDSNSSIHVGEAHAHVPYRGVPFNPAWPRMARVRLPSGEVVPLDLHDEPGCSTAFGVIELPLREKGCIRDFKVEQAKCQLVKALDVIESTVELLNRRMDILLCSNPECHFCPGARQKVRAWDEVTGRLASVALEQEK